VGGGEATSRHPIFVDIGLKILWNHSTSSSGTWFRGDNCKKGLATTFLWLGGELKSQSQLLNAF